MKKLVMALAAIALGAHTAQAASVTYFLEDNAGADPVRIGITLNDGVVAGAVQFTVAVAPNATFPNIADLQGFFFNATNEALVGGFIFTGADLTGSAQDMNNVSAIGGNPNINPLDNFDLGVKIGTAGMGADDIQSTTFLVSHGGALLTNASFLPATFDASGLFAVRATSTGLPGGDRSGSSKMFCAVGADCLDIPCTNDCGGGGGDVPEPTSLILMGLGLFGAATVTRRRR